MVETAIERFSEIRKELAAARSVNEFKTIRDKAEVCRHWAARQGASFVIVHEAACIKLEAERGAGKELERLSRNGGLHKGGRPPENPSHDERGLTLQELGVLNWSDSSRWQTEAELPLRMFKKYLKDCLTNRCEPTSAGLRQQVSRWKAEEKIADIVGGKTVAPPGKFDVIVIDPPWPMERIERDVSPEEHKLLDYPTMTIEEIEALVVPCADDCHVWLWTTHRFLPEAFDLLDAWDLAYICVFVWHKAGGFQPFGLPQYNCEFALYARSGAPVFVDATDLKVCFEAPRGRHSEKPQEFYDLVRRVTGGRRLDMFQREEREGFEGYGNEAGQ